MLTLRNVSTGYNGVDIIKNISMEITSNVSVIGPNGCGKTTLMRAIANILPVRGEILLLGKPYSVLKQKDISKQIALLSQQPSVYFSYSVYETVMMGRYLHIKEKFLRTPGDKDKEVVEESLRVVDMLALGDKDIMKLSGGQLQRVFLARVLAQQPKIILLDEPTNHLDLKYQIEIVNYLKKWAKERGSIVISVLHDLNLAFEISENLILMKDGKIYANGPAGEIIAGNLLNEIYEMDVKKYMENSYKRWS